jgi:hypothetical protein
MATEIGKLKARMKRGPRMSREMRTEYTLVEIDGAQRRMRPEIIAKLRGELERLSHSTDARVMRFVLKMRQRYPEVRP